MSSHTLYDGTIAVAISILKTLSHILRLAEQQRPSATTALLQDARLHEDMYPLADQIRLATQFSEYLVARLTGREPVTLPGNPSSFAEGFERIEGVLKTLGEADKDRVNEEGEKVKMTPMGPEAAVPMSGAAYAHSVVLPNVYFHLTTAYGILRKAGIPLGKKDYYAGFFPDLVAKRDD
ncbi:hypothetical protein P170DRAFT_434703 [Aspergillus steynii IBT 23096]|uniref:DUF1993 domain-containing protein n=1 Tax=Aspergillus steynii IBT 23096 TaxID=1392250 RepID=A0A2I2GJB9_9EURO|nr:uncharacterized protein P170DRAFT_434703 [Aspergillus steynii IBT 23096]PLB52981.1 hypothetical protein P170DRAFT_434703 [Aspergillus steynii IBT 23096]